MTTRSLTLANGLQCHLHQQPDAPYAAALMQVRAGSLHEPDRWPGLAHLLEHLLFCGSENISDDQRLMPWIQQHAGQVNATTQLSDSLFFFQVSAGMLVPGLARLLDMLATPRLSAEAIHQESTVIDAEYHLLQHHAPALSEAALLDMPEEPARLRRFRIGSQAAFGDSVTDLQQALRLFHQRHYVAENMTLWIQGPHPLNELEQLARRYGQPLRSGLPPTDKIPSPSGGVSYRQVQLAGEAALWLTFFLPSGADTVCDNAALYRQFWSDEAPGSLLAQLRAAGLCENITLHWIWRESHRGWLALKFTAQTLSPLQARQIDAQFRHHLGELLQTETTQHQHYLGLARSAFRQLAPLEQLRARATGFEPGITAGFGAGLRLLQACQPRRLLVQDKVNATDRYTQGFRLAVADGPALPALPASTLPHWFYPLFQPPELRPLPDSLFPMLRVTQIQPRQTLIVRPAFCQPVSDAVARGYQRALRSTMAALRHSGGDGSWQQVQGNWLLTLHLPAERDVALAVVQQVVQALSAEQSPHPESSAESVMIRQLLAVLPYQLLSVSSVAGWHAAWSGRDEGLGEDISRALSPLPLADSTARPALHSGLVTLPCSGNDHALLLFIPLISAGDSALAALQALGLIYEPRFFQRLRVELQIGYVVSARYQRVADVDGILLALQSPDVPWRRLLAHCKCFLRTIDMSQVDLPLLQSTLRNQCCRKDNASAALRALRQQQGLAELSPAAIDNLCLTQIQHLHRRLLQSHRQWRVVVGSPPVAEPSPVESGGGIPAGD